MITRSFVAWFEMIPSDSFWVLPLAAEHQHNRSQVQNACGELIMRSWRLLCRRQASEYLLAQHGLDVSPEQLARWAIKGGGPPFHLLAGRIGKAVYCTLDLDKWANGYLGPLVARVAEHPAYQGSAAA